MVASIQGRSWDYPLFDEKHRKIMRKNLSTALTHAKLIEHISAGQETIVCTHAPLLKCDIVGWLHKALREIKGMPYFEDLPSMSRPVIDQVNQLFLSCLFGADEERAQLAARFNSEWSMPGFTETDLTSPTEDNNPFGIFLQKRTNNKADTYKWDIEDRYPGWFNVYGHDTIGSARDSGQAIRSKVAVCLDTKTGKEDDHLMGPKIAKLMNANAEEVEEDPHDDGIILIAAIVPDLNDKEGKLGTMRHALLDGCSAYQRWYSTLSEQAQRAILN